MLINSLNTLTKPQYIFSRTSKILVVDDDSATRTLIYRFFSQKNYQIESADNGANARLVFEQFLPDLVILDVNLPDTTGYKLCQEMQKQTNVFILLLTSRSDLRDKVRGFEMGADDYLTKPFDLQELQYRVDAILRRQLTLNRSYTQPLVFNELVIDPMRQEVTLNDKQVILTALEFKLLLFLASHPNQVWRRSDLIQHVWNSSHIGERLIDTHIGRIRKKIQTDTNQPSLIQTVRGVGYMFVFPPNVAEYHLTMRI